MCYVFGNLSFEHSHMQVLDDRDPDGSADHFLRNVAMFKSQGLSVAAACHLTKFTRSACPL